MIQPPRLARIILNQTHRERLRPAVLGDFEELYHEISAEQGKWAARSWYWMQAIKAVPQYIKFSIDWSLTMFKNYLKVAFRNLLKSKFYTLINVFGLAIGLTVFLFISIYTGHELSYNKFHENHEDLFEIQIDGELSTPAPLAPTIEAQLPEVKAINRIDTWYGGGRAPVLITGTGEARKRIKTSGFLFVDKDFLNIFSFKLIRGDAATALTQPYAMVLTESMARRLFGEEDAMGRNIHYIGEGASVPEMDMTVTAIVEDAPSNSDIQFNGLISFATMHTWEPNGSNVDEDWRNWGYRTHVLLDARDKTAFESKLKERWEKTSLDVWPGDEVPSVGLVSLAETPFFNNNRRQFIFLIQIIGIFVLVIALINFVNLTLARATSRAREVGIRKVVGALRLELVRQFLCESFLLTLIVTPISIIMIEVAKPVYYSIIQQEIAIDWLRQPGLILLIAATIFVIGLVSGLYPALVMASFNASKILKGELSQGRKRNRVRFVLVVLQFVISTALIFCTLVISDQIHFLKTRSLGFDQHNIVHCKQSKQIDEKYDVFKTRLLQHPDIVSMSRINSGLGQALNIGQTLEINGLKKSIRATTVDPDFISTMGLEITEGRDFSWDIASDVYTAIIVNETFVKTFELKNPVGQVVKDFLGIDPVIIGVMKDFHNDSFREPIGPSALMFANWNGTINIRINSVNTPQTLLAIQQVWDELSPNFPMEYHFLNQTYEDLYRSEDVLHRIFISFASMAIFIACLGLLGLISYSARQRTREIGIRKVMGASVQDLMGLLTRQYLLWVFIATIISLPLAAWAMLRWLDDFAYRTVLTPGPFLWASCSALIIALITVGWQALRAALTNPAHALRHE